MVAHNAIPIYDEAHHLSHRFFSLYHTSESLSTLFYHGLMSHGLVNMLTINCFDILILCENDNHFPDVKIFPLQLEVPRVL